MLEYDLAVLNVNSWKQFRPDGSNCEESEELLKLTINV